MTFNAKLWAAHNNVSFRVIDGDDTVRAYLSQFAHRGCGGAPEKGHYKIACFVCRQEWPWMQGTLGEIIAKLPFRSLKV